MRQGLAIAGQLLKRGQGWPIRAAALGGRMSAQFTESRWSAPVTFGALAFFLSTSATAYSDIASLISGANSGDARWQTYLEDAPAGSIHAAEIVFPDPVVTGSTEMVWEDFDVTPPSAPIVVSVADEGVVEFQLLLTKS